MLKSKNDLSRKKILIIGATSTIAQAVAEQLSKKSNQFFLVGLDEVRLKNNAEVLVCQGSQVAGLYTVDLTDLDKHEDIIASAYKALNGLDIVLIAHGTLSDQKACEQSVALTQKELMTNGLSTISLLTLLANCLERQGHGMLAVISSVAGDRGKQSNYVYGAAKGSVLVFLQGLRNRLAKSNVNVLTVKPGYVDTPMIKHMKKNCLWVTPEKVASDIVQAIAREKQVIYSPKIWWLIMFVIKIIPERIFKRLSL